MTPIIGSAVVLAALWTLLFGISLLITVRVQQALRAAELRTDNLED